MSSTHTHTAGTLSVGDDSKWGGEPVRIESDWTTELVAVIKVEDAKDFPRADANARRLVACWNAFENVTTEAIEAYPHEIDARIQQLIRDRQVLVDALAKTETYLLERLASNPGSTGATVILPMIRAAIEGSDVKPTPSSWGDV